MAYRGARSGAVNDLVLLDNLSEQAIVQTLSARHSGNEPYAAIGDVLLSTNPFTPISGLYGNSQSKNYATKNQISLPPHVYGVAQRAYRSMTLKSSNECILITGESGAGKTVAAGHVLEHLSYVTSSNSRVKKIKKQLLETNPLLEAFGNATTRRNDNSSRFGKYFEIQFKFHDPEGGHISQFLLEKNRVTYQQAGERNFHVFYQMLTNSSLRRDLGLSSNHSDFRYFTDPSAANVRSIDDSREFGETTQAMDLVGISGQDQAAVFGILGGILHLGNVEFASQGRDKSVVSNSDALNRAADLLGVSAGDLGIALTHRTVKSGIESVRTGLNVEKAAFARDSLAKSLYGKLFEWIVARANETIHCDQFSTTIGVLDIYGFEILGVNGFEQLCINHTNERLHQLFIELTLRKEQEEYRKEGIPWTAIDFFDNLPICTMIEKRGGVYSLIDEESIFPQGSDLSLMKKLGNNVRDRYFEQTRGTASQFVLKHYAGKVSYDTTGMLDSNKDTLFADLVLVSNTSRNPVIGTFFQDHPAANRGLKTNKRPPTTCMQYKKQLFDLMDKLKECNQHYIRCIKPNDQKRSGLFQNELVTEQVRYLGLLENVKVRRAGYAFRMEFTEFMAMYKVTIKGHTDFEPDARRGTERILKSAGARDYSMGKTKVFIKDARTILGIEDMRKAFLDEAARYLPDDDGLIYADKVMGFNSKYVRSQLYFVVGGKGFYWFAPEGPLEHFVPMEKVDLLAYNEQQGWMVTCSTYPGKLPQDPPVQLSYLSANVYGSEVKNFVEILKTNMNYDINVSQSSSIPADAQDPALYKQNLKMIGDLGVPMLNNGASPAGCCGGKCVVM